jgi:5-methylcytosine-specific restriction endonuclease McrA
MDAESASKLPIPIAHQPSYRKALKQDPCSYCGRITDTQTYDHIQAKINGGKYHWWNLTSACYECNQDKASDSLLWYLLTRFRRHLKNQAKKARKKWIYYTPPVKDPKPERPFTEPAKPIGTMAELAKIKEG